MAGRASPPLIAVVSLLRPPTFSLPRSPSRTSAAVLHAIAVVLCPAWCPGKLRELQRAGGGRGSGAAPPPNESRTAVPFHCKALICTLLPDLVCWVTRFRLPP